MMLACREVIARLSDYLGRELGPLDVARIALHLAMCRACRAYLRTFRATVRLAGRAAAVEMPEEMKRRLRVFLSERPRESPS
jgi:predicted anti-sigma-YlaC factor YlaD